MKVTLTFDLPDERIELFTALCGGQYASALIDIDNFAKACLKHDGDPQAALEDIRQAVVESDVWNEDKF